MAYSLKFNTPQLVQWLKQNGVDDEDSGKISKVKLCGQSFIRMDGEQHFNELGIPLGTRLLLQQLIAQAKRDVASPAPVGGASQANSATQPPGVTTAEPGRSRLSAHVLSQELINVVDWKKLATYLNISYTEITKISRNHAFDLDEQKMALFYYIEKNSRSHDITWGTICDALEGFEGNLAHQLREKYCNPYQPPPDSPADLSTEDPNALGNRHLRAILEVIYDVRAKWRFFGMELDLLAPDLDAIDSLARGNPDDCLRLVLEAWLRRSNPPPRFSDILDALRGATINQGGLANRIERLSSEQKLRIGFNL